jgi:hypothetical protein
MIRDREIELGDLGMFGLGFIFGFMACLLLVLMRSA